MTKSTFILTCSLFIQGIAFGQTDIIKRDTTVTYDQGKYKVVTNHFFDNWFISAAGGAQIFIGDHDKQMKFSERLTPSLEFNLGKWFSPGIGVRAGVNGFKAKGVTQDPALSNGVKYDGKPWEGYWLYEQEFNYFNIHADVLFNLTNIFSGYKADRFYNISPYVGLGWMVTNDAPDAHEVSANVGIYNSFRLSEAFDLNLDIRGAMVNDRFDGEIGKRSDEGTLAANIGVTYKFKRRGWDKPKTTTVTASYDETLLNDLRNKVDQLAADNEALKKQLAESGRETITDIKTEKQILAAPILVTFPINKSTVSNEARVNLGFFADIIKQGSPDVVYKVTGYADKGTGTPKINERLSRERSKAIYRVLVNEFGVPASQLEVSHEGGVDNMFYDDPRLSRAVITIAK